MAKTDEAITAFDAGCNCAQSVLIPFAQDLGMMRETAMKLAAGFGGGMCHLDQTCGAVTGAIMALGLKFGWTDRADRPKRDRLNQMVNELAQRFCEKHKALRCFELLGCDLRTEQGKKRVRDENLRAKLCMAFVRDAAEIVEGMVSSGAVEKQ